MGGKWRAGVDPLRTKIVIPAKAGIQLLSACLGRAKLDPRFRGDDTYNDGYSDGWFFARFFHL